MEQIPDNAFINIKSCLLKPDVNISSITKFQLTLTVDKKCSLVVKIVFIKVFSELTSLLIPAKLIFFVTKFDDILPSITKFGHNFGNMCVCVCL